MIYIVSQYYQPISNPPGIRMGHLGRMLVETYGAENVRIVTGRPNYPEGKLQPGFRFRLFKRRTGEHGEIVHHLYEIPAPFQGLYRKALGLVSFAVSVSFYFLFRRIRKDDIVFLTTGPTFPMYALHLLRIVKRNLRLVIDVRDLWPQGVEAMGHIQSKSLSYRMMLRLSEGSYREARALVGNSDGIVYYLNSLDPAAAPELIYNPVDTARVRPLPESERAAFLRERPALFPEGKTVFVFTGIFSNYVGLPVLIDAIALVAETRRDFLFILIGEGEEKALLEEKITGHKIDDLVVLHPFVKQKSTLVGFINAAHYCFASLKDSPNLEYAIPTKILEYLGCDQRVLAALRGPFADKLTAAEVAIICEPGSAEGLRDAIVRCIDAAPNQQSGESSGPRAFIEEHFALTKFEERYRAFFAKLTDDS